MMSVEWIDVIGDEVSGANDWRGVFRVVWRMMWVEWMDVSCDEVSGADDWRWG